MKPPVPDGASLWSSRLMIAGAALLFSTGGAAIKGIGLTGWQVASFRSLAAAFVLSALLPRARKAVSRAVLPAACAYAATLVLFVLANKLTTSANAIFLQSTAPAFLLFLAPLLLKEPVGRRDALYAMVLLGGMLLLFQGGSAASRTAPNRPVGDLLALASGFTYALTLAALRKGAGREGTSMAVVLAGNFIAFLGCAPMAWPVAAWRWTDLILLAYLGSCQIGLAYVLLTRGMRRVPAFEAATLLLAEPVFNPVVTWLAVGETPSVWALAGGCVIVAATLVKTRLDTPSRT